jgi:hypothetical protein
VDLIFWLPLQWWDSRWERDPSLVDWLNVQPETPDLIPDISCRWCSVQSATPSLLSNIFYGRFEVFTAVVMKSIIFWDVTPCSPSSFSRSEEHISSNFRVEEISSAKTSKQGGGNCWFLLNLFLRPRRWRRCVPPKRRLKLDRLHGVISQKMILFIFYGLYHMNVELNRMMDNVQTVNSCINIPSSRMSRSYLYISKYISLHILLIIKYKRLAPRKKL